MAVGLLKVSAISGPDHHGTVVVLCPWCHHEHSFCWNQGLESDGFMTREAGCLSSKGGLLVITFRAVKVVNQDLDVVPTVQPVRNKSWHRFPRGR